MQGLTPTGGAVTIRRFQGIVHPCVEQDIVTSNLRRRMNWGSMIICAMLFTISDSDYSEDADKFNIVLWFSVRFQQHSFTELYKGAMIEKHNFLSTMTTNNTTEEGSEQEQMQTFENFKMQGIKISVTFIDKDGEEKHIKVPVGMSMLEAAHENDIELEGKSFDFRILLFRLKILNIILFFAYDVYADPSHVPHSISICLRVELLNFVQDVEQNSKLEDPTDEENDMLDLAFGLTETSIPAATQNFAIDGYVPKSH
ncbi:Adrenodoxin-like protein 2, mitochondrial [Glycine soja]